MRRTMAGLTALAVICVIFTPEDSEAGRRSRRCCQPCFQCMTVDRTKFCAESLMMQYVDSGGATHYMYAGKFCAACPSNSPDCTGGGFNSPASLTNPVYCTSSACTETRLFTASGVRGHVKKGHKLKDRVDASMVQSPEPGVVELGPSFVKFKTPDNHTKHAKLHYVYKNTGTTLYVIPFGYEIKNHNGNEDDAGQSTQPDPDTPGWHVVTYHGVDFDVLTTDP